MAKILWIIHNYPTYQNAGAEWMAKEINDYLITQGHEIIVYSKEAPSRYMDGAVEVIPGTPDNGVINSCHCILTHLNESYKATEIAQAASKPIIHVLHHSWEIDILRKPIPNCYIVYNSAWVQADRKYPHESIVVRPPVNPERFQEIEPAQDGYITMVNCNVDKGAMIFQQIARAISNRRFLAVKGHHGPQITMRTRNITQWECQEDIRTVLRETSVLLVPSVYESYGRIAIEAAACGIPVIASDTPGLRESLGSVGKFVSRAFIPAWLQEIHGPKVGEDALRARAWQLWDNSKKELNVLNNLINNICL